MAAALALAEMGSGDGVPWPRGTPLVVELWAAEPLHLDGAVLVVIQRGARDDLTPVAWASYLEASRRWTERWNAYLDGEVTAGRTSYLDSRPRMPEAPPPPRAELRPPRPSAHATWIAGYWQRERAWLWSPGFWRVPEADVVAGQTLEAPSAPPPARAEAPPPIARSTHPIEAAAPAVIAPAPAAATLVWTPGYWTWDGGVYVWIEGAWRVPPQGARWIAPTWTPRRGRFVLQPGGWSIQIGR